MTSILRKFLKFKRLENKQGNQLLGTMVVTMVNTFKVVGVDFAGPLYSTSENRNKKVHAIHFADINNPALTHANSSQTQ